MIVKLKWWTFILAGAILASISIGLIVIPVKGYELLIRGSGFAISIPGAVLILQTWMKYKQDKIPWNEFRKGLLFLFTGMILFIAPDISIVLITRLIGMALMIKSLSIVLNGFIMWRRRFKDWIWPILLIAGMLIAGMILMTNPVIGLKGALIWLKTSMMVLGVLVIGFGFMIKQKSAIV